MMRMALIVVGLMCAAIGALAQTPDSPANRQAAAEQYVREIGLQQMVAESTEFVAKGFPPQDQALVREKFARNLDVERLRTVMVASMAQRFTVEEIQALRIFFGTPVGKSVMGKLRAYMGDILPTVETVTATATGKVLQEMPRRPRQPPAGQK